MFAARYFAPRYFANRYWPPLGGVLVVIIKTLTANLYTRAVINISNYTRDSQSANMFTRAIQTIAGYIK